MSSDDDVAPGTTAEELARDGIVDEAFPGIVARSKLDWRIFGPSDDAALRAFLQVGPDGGCKS